MNSEISGFCLCPGNAQECFGVLWEFRVNSKISGNSKAVLTMLLECSFNTLDMLREFRVSRLHNLGAVLTMLLECSSNTLEMLRELRECF